MGTSSEEKNWFMRLVEKTAKNDDLTSYTSAGAGWTCTITAMEPETEEEKAERLARREAEKRKNRNDAWMFFGMYYIFFSLLATSVLIIRSFITDLTAKPVDIIGAIFNGLGFIAMIIGIIGIIKIIITIRNKEK